MAPDGRGDAREFLQVFARARLDLLYEFSSGADDDPLLAVRFHVDNRVNVVPARRFTVPGDLHKSRMRHFFLGIVDQLLADVLPGKKPGICICQIIFRKECRALGNKRGNKTQEQVFGLRLLGDNRGMRGVFEHREPAEKKFHHCGGIATDVFLVEQNHARDLCAKHDARNDVFLFAKLARQVHDVADRVGVVGERMDAFVDHALVKRILAAVNARSVHEHQLESGRVINTLEVPSRGLRHC